MEGITATTSKKNEVVLKMINVKFLELDDVLYHTNSAVLMPEIPKKDPSTTPKLVTGLRAIALAFKQLEFDPRMSVLIAAHTDSEGDTDTNFELSRKRGQGVHLLMTSGKRDDWAEVSRQQHVIEDYQQILKYMKTHHGWVGCDPGSQNNTWDAKTKEATKAFIEKYNSDIVGGSTPPPGAVVLDQKKMIYFIDNDHDHKWPIDLWRAVYDIYVADIAHVLNMDRQTLDTKHRSKVKFLKNAFNEHYVACGESHPIDAKYKDNYRSQKNRRVEIYFFKEKDVSSAWPSLWAWWFMHPCPTYGKKIHGPDVCPLWHNLLLKKLPVDEEDLTCVGYHLRFVFWDRKTGTLCNMPDGVQIQAYSDIKEDASTDLSARVSYMEDDGIFLVKVKDDPARKHIHFIFSTIQGADKTPRWVRVTIDLQNHAKGTLVSEQQIQLQNNNTPLNQLSLDKQLEYYDLPPQWSSINYFTRENAAFDTGDKFETVLNTKKHYKPYGSNVTSPSECLVFSLDDIVLLDTAGGTQAIRDADHLAPNLDTVPATHTHYPALSNASRVKILVINKTTGRLELYKSGAAGTSSRIPFPTNYIAVKATGLSHAKIVFFRDGFYMIGSQRTVVTAGWEANGFVLGARAAVRNDSQYHAHWPMLYSRTAQGYTGDYDLHYFHRLWIDGNHPISFLVVYVSVSFMRDSRSSVANVPTAAEVLRFVDEGIYTVMEHYNKKQYSFEDDSNSADSVVVFPFVFMDERETFVVNDATQPTSINFDDIANVPALINAINQPRLDAIGGKSKFLALICQDENAPLKYGLAYQWNIRSSSRVYSLFKLNKSAFSEETNKTNLPSLFGSDTIPGVEYGQSYGMCTFAHETGHAIGNADEYINDSFVLNYNVSNPAGGTTAQIMAEPGFDQYFECYTMVKNQSALMFHNLAPRMHHHYYHVAALQDQIDNQELKRRNWLTSKKFDICYKQGGANFRYSRRGKVITIPADMRTPVLFNATNDGQFVLSSSHPRKTIYIAMHYIGSDEASNRHIHLNQTAEYQAIIVIRIKIHVTFHGLVIHPATNTTPATVVPDVYNAGRIQMIKNLWNDLSCRFKLTGVHQDISSIAVHFLPGFSLTAGQHNVHMDFYDTSNPVPVSPVAGTPVSESTALNVYNNASADNLVRHVLNLPNGTVLSNYNNVMGNLGWVSNWVQQKLGTPFQMSLI
jgi:hypothetical protein